MYDLLATLQASTTKTASFNGTAIDLLKRVAAQGLHARVIYSAAANASGSNTVIFSIEESDDNATFYTVASAAAKVITLTTTAQSGVIDIPFQSRKRYVRLVVTIAGAGSTPTITYKSDVSTSPAIALP